LRELAASLLAAAPDALALACATAAVCYMDHAERGQISGICRVGPIPVGTVFVGTVFVGTVFIGGVFAGTVFAGGVRVGTV
jgi:hypothetical protein